MRARTRDDRRRIRSHPPRLAAAAVAALVAIAATVAAATTASAHSALVDSDPAPGDELAAAPGAITLTFNEDVLDMGAAVFVVDEAGVDHAGEPVVDGPTVTTPIEGTLPGGAIEVRWRVVSADGHPISDVLPFTVAGAAPVATEDADASEAPASAAPVETTASDDAAAPDGAAATAEAPGVPRTLLVGVAGAAAALVLLGIVLGIRRSRQRTRAAQHD